MKASRIYLIGFIALLCFSLMVGCGKAGGSPEAEGTQEGTEKKEIVVDTWDDYTSLSEEEKQAFRDRFESEEDFDAWQQEAQFGSTDKPWEAENAKQPSEYTWEEFESLSPAQQMAFQNSFETPEAFEAWTQKVQDKTEQNPWETESTKQPAEYTWEEFEALTPAQQMAFQNSFETAEAFEAWMEKVQFRPQQNPWEKEGAKQPSEYTLAEFEALTPAQQMAFQNSFGSLDEFDKWLTANEGD